MPTRVTKKKVIENLKLDIVRRVCGVTPPTISAWQALINGEISAMRFNSGLKVTRQMALQFEIGNYTMGNGNRKWRVGKSTCVVVPTNRATKLHPVNIAGVSGMTKVMNIKGIASLANANIFRIDEFPAGIVLVDHHGLHPYMFSNYRK